MNAEINTSNFHLTQNELDASLSAIQSIEDVMACYEKIEKVRHSLNTKDYSKIGLKINETQAEKILELTKISSFLIVTIEMLKMGDGLVSLNECQMNDCIDNGDWLIKDLLFKNFKLSSSVMNHWVDVYVKTPNGINRELMDVFIRNNRNKISEQNVDKIQDVSDMRVCSILWWYGLCSSPLNKDEYRTKAQFCDSVSYDIWSRWKLERVIRLEAENLRKDICLKETSKSIMAL